MAAPWLGSATFVILPLLVSSTMRASALAWYLRGICLVVDTLYGFTCSFLGIIFGWWDLECSERHRSVADSEFALDSFFASIWVVSTLPTL